MKNLTLREKIGQKLIINIQGKEITNEAKRMIEEYKVGGIILYRKNYDTYEEMIKLIKSYGIKPGLAINPETDIEDVFEDLKNVSLVLLMSVHPGKSGQEFIEETTNKISVLKEEIKKKNLNVKISIDNPFTFPKNNIVYKILINKINKYCIIIFLLDFYILKCPLVRILKLHIIFLMY